MESLGVVGTFMGRTSRKVIVDGPNSSTIQKNACAYHDVQ